MKQIKYILIIFLFIGLNAQAQKSIKTNTLLWEISGNGLKKPSYLFGTYHFAGKTFLDSMKTVNSKLASSDVIIGELLLNDSLLPQKLMPFMQLKDTTLNKLFSEDEYKIVADYLKEVSGYDLKFLNGMNPAAVQMMLLQFTAPKTIGKDNPALDIYFQDYATANKKKILGLETIEDQGKALFGRSLARQKEQLLDNIKNKEKYKKQGEDLYQFYIRQDLDAIKNLFSKKDGYTEEEFDQLIKNRNQNWIDELPEMMKNQSAFIAVGVGHMVDRWSLITLLKEKGYTVKPIPTN
ncbi:TraB/GumN family protein [Pedobacter fastidiosus]|uniref:TraB/GumN family protein n=1 Tax=Pedobacter fastidiosus TaxID=2765361 RepID=A0ABR7KLI5_9SPHI|nr:TraB/GumN family protein [Pedobacter fastidiosus]MBC6108934.1 TraB/GumN family protein [Pedobacter fastidiosus]